MSGRIAFTEVDASGAGREALERFYRRLYVREFPDPDERESLANMARYLALKASGWYGANNYHVIVMERDGEPIGGSVSDYLAVPNTGVIEFLFVRGADRGRGHGGALLRATVERLRRDARAAGKALDAVVAEMNDPFRRQAVADNMDPFERAAIWGGWGFAKLDFEYRQPALSRGQKPVAGLALVARWLGGGERPSADAGWVREVLREYMRWAMRIAQPSRNGEYRAMARQLRAGRRVPLVPLRDYVGRDPAKRFAIEAIGARHRAFAPAMALLLRRLRDPGELAPPADFRRALAVPASPACRYHLWRLAAPGSDGIDGVASFFTLRRCGFGGYIALDRRLRGRGLLRPLVARIEEAMVKDATQAEGWLIECDAHNARVFRRVGFRDVRVDYRPPRVGDADGRAGRGRLALLYKAFGRAGGPAPPRRFALECVADILRQVYGVRSPRRHECYRRARALRPRRARA